MQNLMAHPIQAAAEAVGAVGGDPRVAQRSTLFQGANDGPATVAAKITGMVSGGMREDNAPYFTNNEAHPFPLTQQDCRRSSFGLGHFPLLEATDIQQIQAVGKNGAPM